VDPSPEHPLTGQCACGGVRFEITAPFESARYCHCHRCQRRTGATSSVNARLPRESYVLLEGDELLRSWQPPDGMGKWFCADCGGQLYSANEGEETIFVRLGTIDGDPGVRPIYHQWVSSAVTWEALPDDGLPHYPAGGP
jgi:hypothetical protein